MDKATARVIDWDKDPEPDFMPPQNMVELRTMDDAMKLIEQWIEAYDELRQAYVRLHSEYSNAIFREEFYKTLASNEEALRLHPIVDLLPA